MRHQERPMTALGALLLLATAWPDLAWSQVGHDPMSSPYQDLRIKQTVSLIGGYLSGGRGSANVGPSGGNTAGVRWDVAVGAPTVAYFGIMRGDLERNLVNPAEGEDTRFFGTARQDVYIADAGLDLILTGRKTWHRLAPYAGAAMGMAFGGSVPEDSVFSFNTKFHVGPHVGVRWHPNRRFHVRLEARNILWRLSYPNVFFETPVNAPDDPPLLDPVVLKRSEWTHHALFTIAVAYTLRL